MVDGLYREGPDVLVHPLTESSYDDHSKNALWLGTPVPMQLEILPPTYRTELLPKASATKPAGATSAFERRSQQALGTGVVDSHHPSPASQHV